ncbi:MAG: hypothetical protein ACJAYU_001049 [Bradymonadia bacterium]|jgi:hypothetical protein
MEAADPILPGTTLYVSARGVQDPRGTTLRLSRGDANALISSSNTDGLDLEFEMSQEAFSVFGLGEHSLRIQLRSNGDESESWTWLATFSDQVPLDIDRMPAGIVSWGQELVVSGTGFSFPSEGTCRLAIEGQFETDAGDVIPVVTSYGLTPVERSNRRRASFLFDPNFGTLESGQLIASATARTTLNNGQTFESEATPFALDVRPAAVLDLSPLEYSVGQIVEILGTGFVSPERGTNRVTFQGTFTGDQGRGDIDVDLVPTWINEGLLRLTVEPIVDEANTRLLDSWFLREWGVFSGELTVTITTSVSEFETIALPLNIRLDPPGQIVLLDYLTGFTSSLDRYGLGSASAQVQAQILERLRTIYDGYRVDFLLEAPRDISPDVISVVEVGGPDPNGLGLLGYDSSPGKDVGNLRLGDTIGGASAETQSDGAAGYGGVFIESYLWWSMHPELSESRPEGAPVEDPLFDPVFDAVRAGPASLSEAQGIGEPERIALVAEAIRVLGNIIGETVAHEVGHSLGLADPSGPATSFHNPFDGQGCLMDGGIDRPFGERAELPGFTATRFCGESASYLQTILGE